MTHTEQSSNATVSIADCGQMFKEVSMLEYMHYKRLEKIQNGMYSWEAAGQTTYQSHQECMVKGSPELVLGL